MKLQSYLDHTVAVVASNPLVSAFADYLACEEVLRTAQAEENTAFHSLLREGEAKGVDMSPRAGAADPFGRICDIVNAWYTAPAWSMHHETSRKLEKLLNLPCGDYIPTADFLKRVALPNRSDLAD
jgi:hypothetical protein